MKVLVLLFLLMPVISLGQDVVVDFENTEITDWFSSDIAHWCISDQNPLAGKYSLQHCYDNESSGTDWITLLHAPINTSGALASWEFSLRYNFNPSGNNHWAVCLSDNYLPTDEGALEQGLILGVNFIGSSDELKLWRVTRGEAEEILNTGFNWEKNLERSESVQLQLILGADNTLELSIKTSESAWQSIGTVVTELPESINLFTLYYKYTATYDMGLSLDDLKIAGSFKPDKAAPAIERISVQSSNTLQVEFNEPIYINTDHNWCIDGVGCSSDNDGIKRRLLLNFPFSMKPGYHYNLQVPAITDLYENPIQSEFNLVDFYYPRSYDLVINEILADPTPEVLLPYAEYLELYNRSGETYSISHWKIQVNSASVTLPDLDIEPEGYYLLVNESDQEFFNEVENVIRLERLPTLSNGGALVILQEASGRLIHAVEYFDDWHSGSLEREGGYSLEMINPSEPCAQEHNWKSSTSYRGGTPGEKNSVFDSLWMLKSPKVYRVGINQEGNLNLYFSEPTDSATISSTQYYQVDQGIGKPFEVVASWPLALATELLFEEPFREGAEYKLSITSDLKDCAGNTLEPRENLLFQKPVLPDSGDILINEILFDPLAGRQEFIELINVSDYTINLKHFRLSVGDSKDTSHYLTLENWPLAPGKFAVIANNPAGIDSDDEFAHPELIIPMRSMPRLPNDGEMIYLFSEAGQLMDVAEYNPGYHHKILVETQGVSLERISTQLPGTDPSNWHSATADAGYMTPAALNSVVERDVSMNQLELSSKKLSLNGDGLNETLTISYTLDKEGYMGQVFIFDLEGRRQFIITDGELLGTEGSFSFDGRGEDGQILPTGYYIVFFNAYNTEGERFAKKLSFVISR